MTHSQLLDVEARASGPAPLVAWLLSEVDDREPDDAARIAGFDMIEVHPAGDDLVVAVPDVPILRPTKRAGVMLEQRDQDSARRVDPDDAVIRQVDELDDLGIRRLLELVGHVV